MSFTRKSIRDHELDAREQAGLPVLTCTHCGARVTRTTGHYVPEHLDEDGLIVRGEYTCEVTE
ncbi:hypothetical protein [Humibacter sp.]|uniref:hypothetical protein n=1 Tax=Humibacter sp. TaxID=1940291 RepID=UPI003F7EC475